MPLEAASGKSKLMEIFCNRFFWALSRSMKLTMGTWITQIHLAADRDMMKVPQICQKMTPIAKQQLLPERQTSNIAMKWFIIIYHDVWYMPPIPVTHDAMNVKLKVAVASDQSNVNRNWHTARLFLIRVPKL
jgi:hypothetical protein